MSSLKKLYIAGNGLYGDINLLALGNLTELSLTSNRIQGTLPREIFDNHSFAVLDISMNRITGGFDYTIFPDLDADSSGGSIMKASVNRLSGTLKTSSVDRFAQVKIVNGNLMSCGSVPSTDEDKAHYVCETTDLSSSFIAFASILAFTILALAFFCWQYNTDNIVSPNIRSFVNEFR